MAFEQPPLNYSSCLDRLVRDIVEKTPDLSHIRPDALALTFNRSRTREPHGLFAKIVPMRFEGGVDTRVVRKATYRMNPLVIEGREILYIIYFCLPKFQNLSFEDKLTTVFHELYHISPAFNGDIRRFPGRNFAHGSSRAGYNRTVKRLVEAYLSVNPDGCVLDFLHPTADELLSRHGRLTGLRIPLPKLERLSA